MKHEHVVIGRGTRKAPPRRCAQERCAMLTRHRSQRCPEHRGTASRRRGAQ